MKDSKIVKYVYGDENEFYFLFFQIPCEKEFWSALQEHLQDVDSGTPFFQIDWSVLPKGVTMFRADPEDVIVDEVEIGSIANLESLYEDSIEFFDVHETLLGDKNDWCGSIIYD